ncbi:MAG: peptide chain release factor 2 [Clostridiaceae bacterium]|nr:peptide chain release factor 2 [Clostridiaceae bacterium]
MKKSVIHFDLPAITKELEELNHRTTEPTFYDDFERSKEIMQSIKKLQSKLDRYEKLKSQAEDLEVLNALGEEENDATIIGEIKEGIERLRKTVESFKLEILLNGEYDTNNAILTLHAGSGGTEAMDWCEMLLRMYTRWCEAKGYNVKIVDLLPGEVAGIKKVTFFVEGEYAYGYLKAEKGVHRLVRISPFDASGRRHTSFASLDVMPEITEDVHIDIRPEDLRVDTYRSSGAGGQHVNKTSSAVRITHLPTGIVVACQSERSQHQNKDTAMKMLMSKLIALKKQENKERIEDLKGEQLEITWGSQIRSYVFCPYTLVKDHRTGYEMGDVEAVMDGELDGFINSYLFENAQLNA